MQTFAGRVAVITGAAGGFGFEFARLAAALEMRVALADVDAVALERAREAIHGLGAQVIACPTDVSDAAQMDVLAEHAYQKFGAVNLLFNNAGVAPVGLVWEARPVDWQWTLSVNVLGVANGLRSFIPRMLEQRDECHVINTASVAGFISPSLMGLYNASKHAVVAISETLHHDLRSVGSGIGVTVLCPAFVPTGISDSERNRPRSLSVDEPPTQATLQAREAMRRAVSSGRLTAAEVAQMTFDAIRKRQFYLFTHPSILPAVRSRHTAIIEARDPDDPLAARRSRSIQ